MKIQFHICTRRNGWCIFKRRHKRATKLFKTKSDAVYWAGQRNLYVIVHNEHAEVECILGEE